MDSAALLSLFKALAAILVAVSSVLVSHQGVATEPAAPPLVVAAPDQAAHVDEPLPTAPPTTVPPSSVPVAPGPSATLSPSVPPPSAVSPVAPEPTVPPVAPADDAALPVAPAPEPGADSAGGGELLWSQDFESGTDTGMSAQEPSGLPAEVINDPGNVRSGSYAMKFHLAADAGGDQYGQRSERVPEIADQKEGDELYFALSTKLASGFPIDNGWQVITQWHSAMDGSPPIELSVEEGKYQLSGGYGHPDGLGDYVQNMGAAVAETWVDWVFHIKFSTDPSVAFIEVWKDGQIVVPRFAPATATMYDEKDYWKFGYYRSKDVGADGTIYFDDLKVGTSLPAVTS